MARTKTTEEKVTFKSGTRYYGEGPDQIALIVHTGAVRVRFTRPVGISGRIFGGTFRFEAFPYGNYYTTATMEQRGEIFGITDTRAAASPFALGWRS